MKKHEALQTIAILTLACLAGFFLFHKVWLIVAGASLLALGIVSGKAAAFIAGLWRRFGMLLGSINSRILLGAVFYLVLTPVAVLYRLFNKKQVGHFKEQNDTSYFRDVSSSYGQEYFKRMW